MTSQFGLTDQGFVAMTLQDVRNVLNSKWQALQGLVDVSDNALEGQLFGILAEVFALIWELAEAVYSAQDPDAATGGGLDALAALTGTFRQAATKSAATLTLCGDPGTVVPATSLAAQTSTGQSFATLVASAAFSTLPIWVATTAYAVGDRITRASRGYQCTTAGTSAGSGGPTSTADDITDGSVHWRYLGEGTGAIDVAALCTVTGPVTALSNDIAVIQTPVLGWKTVKNLLDAVPGTNLETDAALRVRRREELSRAGNSTPDAIRADILEVGAGTNNPVTACTVFYNNTDTTDGDGVPPHSVEVLVQGGVDQDVANAVFAAVAAGIGTRGGTTMSVTDSEGFSHNVSFSRPTAVPVYVDVQLTVFLTATGTAPPIVPLYPSDGDAQVKGAVVTYGGAQPVGKDVVSMSVGAQAFKVAGVLDVAQTLVWTAAISTSPPAWAPTTGYTSGNQVTNDGRQYVCTTSGTSAGSGGPSTTAADITDGTAHWRWLGATITMTSRQLATFDSSRVTLHDTNGTP